MISQFWHTLHLKNTPLASLYWTHSILCFGLSLVGIFIPVYIYQLTGNFFYLPAFYALASTVALTVFLFGAGIVARLGVTRLVLISNLSRIFNLMLLLLAAHNPMLIFLAAVFEGLVYPTYWVSYHLIFTSRGHNKSFGREIGWMGIFVSLVSALAPLVGGLVISAFGFTALYGLGMIVVLLSSFPIFFAGDHLEFHPMGASQIVKESLTPGWRPMLAGLFAMRLEIYFSMIFWAIFLFVTLGSYTVLGGFATLQIIVGVVLMLTAGRLVDKAGSRKVFPWSAALLAPFWVLVGFFSSVAVLIPLVVYRSMLGPFYGISADSLYYSVARRDPYSAVIKREFAIHISIIVWCALAALLWFFFPAQWPVFFITAALGPLIAIVMVKAK
ncbi:MAG: hypothetical protein Q8L46_01505 [candidate division WWE3 bacterium]|nr:hypothetical protein [candidate division WWE3 bacterium]